MASNEEIWNQSLPPDFKTNYRVLDADAITNRRSWAREIHIIIEVIEESTHPWDEDSIIILDDAYDYCDAYGLKVMRDRIKELHTKFWDSSHGHDLVVNMNYLRHFFHDEWMKPLDNTWANPDDYEEDLKNV